MHQSKGLLVSATILIAVSFILAAAISVLSLRTVISDYDRELAVNVASRINDSLAGSLRAPVMVGRTMANSRFLRDYLKSGPHGDEEQCYARYLENFCMRMGFNSAFVVDARTRRYYARHGFNKIVDPVHDAHDIWYRLFVDGGKDWDFDVDKDENDNLVWTVFVNCRITDDDGTLLGVAGVGVRMTDLQDMIRSYEQQYGLKINITNDSGLVQVDTNDINIQNSILSLKKHSGAGFSYERQGNSSFVIRKPLKEFGWDLVITKNADVFRGSFSGLVRHLVIAFGVIMLFLLGLVNRMISKEHGRLTLKAASDPLTGLLNKESFAREVDARLASSDGSCIAFLFMDLDNFKDVNDLLGHQQGDAVLKKLASVLCRVFRREDVIGRFGGDEFFIFLRGIPRDLLELRIRQCLELIRTELSRPLGGAPAGPGNVRTKMERECGGKASAGPARMVRNTVSIGALWKEHASGECCRDLVGEADKALYEAKQNGRDCYVLHDLSRKS